MYSKNSFLRLKESFYSHEDQLSHQPRYELRKQCSKDRYILVVCAFLSSLVSFGVLLTVMFRDILATSLMKTPHAERGHEAVFWRPEEEELAPAGFTLLDDDRWRNVVDSRAVVGVVKGPCGRMQNRQIILEDGTKACARYRINDDQLQGEVFTHHLARLLGIGNTPPTRLVLLNFSSPSWSRVHEDLVDAEWKDGRPMVLTQWVPDAHPVEIPQQLRVTEPGPPTIHPKLRGLANLDVRNLVQWSDLILLDYLTGNLDRYVNSLVNAAWNDRIMDEPAHNLDKVAKTGLLLFLDNESGLFHAYRLLDRYQHHHWTSLGRMCVFRRKTVSLLKSLPKDVFQLEELLNSIVLRDNPDMASLPRLSRITAQILTERVEAVNRHVENCTTTYNA